MKGLFRLSLWAVLASSGCIPVSLGLVEINGRTMGTSYRVSYAGAVAQPRVSVDEVETVLVEINRSMSPYLDNSLVSIINSSRDTAQIHKLDPHFLRVFSTATKIYGETYGAFDPAMGPLIRAWGFGRDQPHALDSVSVKQILEYSRFESFQLAGPDSASLIKLAAEAELDFGAIAKGYAVDELGRMLERNGIVNYLVEIGGEVRARGLHPENRSWMIGIEKPLETFREFSAIVQLGDRSMATSGNYRNFYWKDGRKIVHTLNPNTGYPEVNSLLSVSVVTSDCMIADAFATAFMVMGKDRAVDFVSRRSDLDVFFIYGGDSTGFETYSTPGFQALMVSKPGE